CPANVSWRIFGRCGDSACAAANATSRRLLVTFIEIFSSNQRAHLGIRNRAWQHPKAAIGMYEDDTIGAEYFGGVIDPARDQIGLLDAVILDVDHTQAQADALVEIAESLQLVIAAPR